MKTKDFSNSFSSKFLILDVLAPIVEIVLVICCFDIVSGGIQFARGKEVELFYHFHSQNVWLFIGLGELFVLIYRAPLYRNRYWVNDDSLFIQEYVLLRKVVDVQIPLSQITQVSIATKQKGWDLDRLWKKQLTFTVGAASYTIDAQDHALELMEYINNYKAA